MPIVSVDEARDNAGPLAAFRHLRVPASPPRRAAALSQAPPAWGRAALSGQQLAATAAAHHSR